MLSPNKETGGTSEKYKGTENLQSSRIDSLVIRLLQTLVGAGTTNSSNSHLTSAPFHTRYSLNLETITNEA